MEYLKRASPAFVATELRKLDLLDAADKAADKALAEAGALHAFDRKSRHAVRRLSATDVEHSLCAFGLEADQLDRRMSALLRAHGITCRDDTSLLVKFLDSLRPHKRAAMVALATCAMILAIAETWHLGALPPPGESQFMQLAGPTPEW
jgi:hypothetical protein